MARPNFPMMGVNIPGIPSNIVNLSQTPPIPINMIPHQMGAFTGMMPSPIQMHGI